MMKNERKRNAAITIEYLITTIIVLGVGVCLLSFQGEIKNTVDNTKNYFTSLETNLLEDSTSSQENTTVEQKPLGAFVKYTDTLYWTDIATPVITNFPEDAVLEYEWGFAGNPFVEIENNSLTYTPTIDDVGKYLCFSVYDSSGKYYGSATAASQIAKSHSIVWFNVQYDESTGDVWLEPNFDPSMCKGTSAEESVNNWQQSFSFEWKIGWADLSRTFYDCYHYYSWGFTDMKFNLFEILQEDGVPCYGKNLSVQCIVTLPEQLQKGFNKTTDSYEIDNVPIDTSQFETIHSYCPYDTNDQACERCTLTVKSYYHKCDDCDNVENHTFYQLPQEEKESYGVYPEELAYMCSKCDYLTLSKD